MDLERATSVAMKDKLARCVRLAEDSSQFGGFPVGSIIFDGEREVSRGISATESLKDVTAHAEVQAIRAAGDVKNFTLYSSLEPCMMCLAACAWAGIARVVYACPRSAVSDLYYESSATLDQLGSLLVYPIEFVPVFDQESYVVSLIRSWEVQRCQN